MTVFCKRKIKALRSLMKAEHKGNSVLLLSSSKGATKSRDTEYRYRPDSNLYYLTNSTGKELNLLISTKYTKPILLAPPPDPKRITWEGYFVDYKKLAKSLSAELILVNNITHEIKEKIKDHEVLYHQNTKGTNSWSIASELLALPYFMRSKLPSTFIHCDKLMESARLYKDKHEISQIKRAAKITNEALFETVPFITPLALESDIGSTIDYLFKIQGGEPSFNTIVATGPSAAVLHYEEQNRKLKNGELLLIDCGASYNYYAADITRTLPINGHFNAIQKDLYTIVLEAQLAAIHTARPNVSIKKVYDVAVKILTQGLVDVGVLKGKVSKLISKEAYKPYFMHGIGHTLGLDVHDLGNLRDKGEGLLKPGMVITIEPGIYFQKKTKHIPACGIRIEDDILIKKGSAEVLSEGFPKGINEIEELLNL